MKCHPFQKNFVGFPVKHTLKGMLNGAVLSGWEHILNGWEGVLNGWKPFKRLESFV